MSTRLSVSYFTGYTTAFGPAFQAVVKLTNDYNFPIDPIGISAELYHAPDSRLLASASSLTRISSGVGLFGSTLAPRQSRDFRLILQIPFGVVVYVDRQRHGDPQFSLKAWGTALHQEGSPNHASVKAIGEQEQLITIAESDWGRWVDSWGRETAWLYVSGPAALKLQELKQVLGKLADEDLIMELAARVAELESIKSGQKYGQEFLVTLPEERQIRGALDTLVDQTDSNSTLSICCQTLDGALQPSLLRLLRRKAILRILMRPLDNVKEKGVKDAVEALRREGAQIRHSRMVHARLYVTSDACIITSADPKTDSLDVNREAAIWTNAPSVVERARSFFEVLWEESKEQV